MLPARIHKLAKTETKVQMAVTKRVGISDLSFSCPTVGPKDYVTKGPSGWPEAFRRQVIDAKLEAFVKAQAPTMRLAELVDLFVLRRENSEDQEPTGWFTITGFLARMLNTHPASVPHECAIAFWGQVVVATASRDAN